MEIPLLDKVEDSLSIEIWFRPLQPNGLSTAPPLCVCVCVCHIKLLIHVPNAKCVPERSGSKQPSVECTTSK